MSVTLDKDVAGTTSRDQADVGPGAVFGFVSLRSGDTALIAPRSSAGSHESDPLDAKTGVIYTERADMPTLEHLLGENEVAFAVLERPVSAVTAAGTHVARQRVVHTDRHTTSQTRVILASGIGVATSAVGWTLFADSVAESAIRANPYSALSFALGGIVLLLSVFVALHGPPRK